MWTCRDCAAEWEPNSVLPQADDIGYYFICPDCDYRNLLLVIREVDGSPSVIQPDFDRPNGASWCD